MTPRGAGEGSSRGEAPRTRERRIALLAFGALLLITGCRPKKPPIAKRVWLGPNGGCVDTPVHETSGTFACWGVNDAGQIGDGTTTSRPFATRMSFPAGAVSELAIGERHACGLFGKHVDCWGAGDLGQLGRVIAQGSPIPVRASNESEESARAIAVGVGGAHTCIGAGSRLRCFGSNESGQLGDDEWLRHYTEIRSFALGEAHTCAAYAATASTRESVVCRGRDSAAPKEEILVGVPVKELAAGGDHSCAMVGDGTVSCWGKNDAGQLGDGTTTDSLTPVTVPGLSGVIQVAAGARHTCVLLQNGTVACWGANERHQLAIGTTENSTKPRIVVGLVGGREIVAAGDGTCARLEGGYVRCWGRSDRDQLGSGSHEEHSVPVQIQFR